MKMKPEAFAAKSADKIRIMCGHVPGLVPTEKAFVCLKLGLEETPYGVEVTGAT